MALFSRRAFKNAIVLSTQLYSALVPLPLDLGCVKEEGLLDNAGGADDGFQKLLYTDSSTSIGRSGRWSLSVIPSKSEIGRLLVSVKATQDEISSIALEAECTRDSLRQHLRVLRSEVRDIAKSSNIVLHGIDVGIFNGYLTLSMHAKNEDIPDLLRALDCQLKNLPDKRHQRNFQVWDALTGQLCGAQLHCTVEANMDEPTLDRLLSKFEQTKPVKFESCLEPTTVIYEPLASPSVFGFMIPLGKASTAREAYCYGAVLRAILHLSGPELGIKQFIAKYGMACPPVISISPETHTLLIAFNVARDVTQSILIEGATAVSDWLSSLQIQRMDEAMDKDVERAHRWWLNTVSKCPSDGKDLLGCSLAISDCMNFLDDLVPLDWLEGSLPSVVDLQDWLQPLRLETASIFVGSKNNPKKEPRALEEDEIRALAGYRFDSWEYPKPKNPVPEFTMTVKNEECIEKEITLLKTPCNKHDRLRVHRNRECTAMIYMKLSDQLLKQETLSASFKATTLILRHLIPKLGFHILQREIPGVPIQIECFTKMNPFAWATPEFENELRLKISGPSDKMVLKATQYLVSGLKSISDSSEFEDVLKGLFTQAKNEVFDKVQAVEEKTPGTLALYDLLLGGSKRSALSTLETMDTMSVDLFNSMITQRDISIFRGCVFDISLYGLLSENDALNFYDAISALRPSNVPQHAKLDSYKGNILQLHTSPRKYVSYSKAVKAGDLHLFLVIQSTAPLTAAICDITKTLKAHDTAKKVFVQSRLDGPCETVVIHLSQCHREADKTIRSIVKSLAPYSPSIAALFVRRT